MIWLSRTSSISHRPSLIRFPCDIRLTILDVSYSELVVISAKFQESRFFTNPGYFLNDFQTSEQTLFTNLLLAGLKKDLIIH
jgi:hypothetical protein